MLHMQVCAIKLQNDKMFSKCKAKFRQKMTDQVFLSNKTIYECVMYTLRNFLKNTSS